MSWVILFTTIGLIWVVWRSKKWNPFWLRAILVLIAGCALADTGLGAWLSNRLVELLGNLPPSVPTLLLIGGAGLVGIVFVVYQLRDKSADKREMIVLVLLPTLLLPAIGPLGDAGQGTRTGVNEVSAGSIGRLIGG